MRINPPPHTKLFLLLPCQVLFLLLSKARSSCRVPPLAAPAEPRTGSGAEAETQGRGPEHMQAL